MARGAGAAGAAIWMLLAVLASPAGAVGFQYGAAPNPDGKPIELGIWYPSDAPTSPQQLGLFTQDVAPYGSIGGQTTLPLIIISHGTGGGAASHYDTALALANAGFVVVAMTYIGDNYQDHSLAFTPRNFVSRAEQVSRVIDYMLGDWPLHAHIDPTRIGIFGHSAGGATALIVLGGNPDFSLASLFCRDHPEAWDCIQVKAHGDALATPAAATASVPKELHHDPRVKAAAIAALAIGYTFTKAGLATVTEPIQLWRAENDVIAANQWNSDVIEAALPRPPEDHLVPGAQHFSFLAPCSEALDKIAPDICRDPPGFDRVAFHRQLNQALIDFFKARLPAP
jgi:predicted dienelactone hydrolase